MTDPEEVVVTRSEVDMALASAQTSKRLQKTWYVTEEVIARVNAAVYWALPMTLAKAADPSEVNTARIPDSASALVESALWAEVLRLEKGLNDGRPFPAAPGKLAPGPSESARERMRRSGG